MRCRKPPPSARCQSWARVWGKSQIRRFVEAEPDGIVLHDHGVIIAANRHVRRILGYPLRDILWHNLKEFVSPGASVRFIKWLEGQPVELLLLGRRQNGEAFPLHLRTLARIIYLGHRVQVTSVSEADPTLQPFCGAQSGSRDVNGGSEVEVGARSK